MTDGVVVQLDGGGDHGTGLDLGCVHAWTRVQLDLRGVLGFLSLSISNVYTHAHRFGWPWLIPVARLAPDRRGSVGPDRSLDFLSVGGRLPRRSPGQVLGLSIRGLAGRKYVESVARVLGFLLPSPRACTPACAHACTGAVGHGADQLQVDSPGALGHACMHACTHAHGIA